MRCLQTVALFASLRLLTAQQNATIEERLRRAFGTHARFEQAATELEHKNFPQVERMLGEEAVANPPKRPELLALQGALEFLGGRMQPAIEKFSEATKLAPLNDSDRFTLAMAWIRLGDDQHARDELFALAQKNPDRALYAYWLGRIDYDQRRYQEAVSKLERAVKLDPTSARSWDSLGLAFDMQGSSEQALGAFEKAAELNRGQRHPSPWPSHNLGYLLLRTDRLPQAEAALRESLRYDPSLTVSQYHLGRTLEKLGRDVEAIEFYKQAVESDAHSTDACYSLAMLYRKLHRDAEAQTAFAEYRRRKVTQK
jgi:tetratricopeptide (TPR) repeat protein